MTSMKDHGLPIPLEAKRQVDAFFPSRDWRRERRALAGPPFARLSHHLPAAFRPFCGTNSPTSGRATSQLNSQIRQFSVLSHVRL